MRLDQPKQKAGCVVVLALRLRPVHFFLSISKIARGNAAASKHLPLRISSLREYVRLWRGLTRNYGEWVIANVLQVAAHQLCPQFRISISGGDSEEMNFRAAERQRQRKCIVD